MRRLSVAVVPLLLSACAMLEDPVRPAVLPYGPGDITVSPPAQIGFDDLEPIGNSYHPIYGSVALLHSDKGACCQFGRCTGSRAPCVVDVERAFEQIDEYRRARASGLSHDSPDYILLLTRANERFADSLGQYLSDSRLYDTVFVRGSVRLRFDSKARGIPDVTDELIRRLR